MFSGWRFALAVACGGHSEDITGINVDRDLVGKEKLYEY